MEKPPEDNVDTEQSDKSMSLIDHLSELRDRLLRSVLAVLLVFAGLFYFSNDIYTLVSAPLRKFLPAGASMIATEVASPFLAPFKLTMVLSVFLAMPYILHQVWAFISPGMYRHEKRIALPVLMSSVVLFYCGIAFAYFVVFPLVFGFFTRVAPAGVEVMTDINAYLDFVLKLFFAFGIAFEIPVATVLMIWAGITTPQALASKRPFVIVGCFVVGMLLTPPDMISQTMLAVPVWLLFEAGVFFGRWVVRSEPQSEPEEEG